MPRVINVGRLRAGATGFKTSNLTYANGQTYLQGAPLVHTLGVVSECAANPVVIYGFAAAPAASGLGYGAANSPTQVTGRVQSTPIWEANDQEFTAALVNGSAVLVAPTVADVGVTTYGLSKQTINGVPTWVVDKAATASVQITKIDTDLNIVYFKVKVAMVQVL
jgi:hypothetical protein